MCQQEIVCGFYIDHPLDIIDPSDSSLSIDSGQYCLSCVVSEVLAFHPSQEDRTPLAVRWRQFLAERTMADSSEGIHPDAITTEFWEKYDPHDDFESKIAHFILEYPDIESTRQFAAIDLIYEFMEWFLTR
jgi:hypothetical protein